MYWICGLVVRSRYLLMLLLDLHAQHFSFLFPAQQNNFRKNNMFVAKSGVCKGDEWVEWLHEGSSYAQWRLLICIITIWLHTERLHPHKKINHETSEIKSSSSFVQSCLIIDGCGKEKGTSLWIFPSVLITLNYFFYYKRSKRKCTRFVKIWITFLKA